jgi:hypothetical protein
MSIRASGFTDVAAAIGYLRSGAQFLVFPAKFLAMQRCPF